MKATAIRLGLLAGLLLFLFFGDVPERSRFWSAFFDAGHTPLFGVIALLLLGLLNRRTDGLPRKATWVLAFGLTVLLGAATEVLQMLQRHGDPSVVDLLRDTAGALAFLLLAAAVRRDPAWRRGPEEERAPGASRRPMVKRGAMFVAAVLILAAAGATLLVTSAAYLARNRAFPTLYPMDGAWWERQFIEVEQNDLQPGTWVSIPGDGSASRTRLARLDLRPARYSGITLAEPYPDWRGYSQLVFTIVSDLREPLPLAIRVHDAAHDRRYADRFNMRLVVQPGRNRVVIPLERIRRAPDRRDMDLAHVKGILLFTAGLQRRTHLYLGPVALE